jgi:acetyl esterase
VTANPHELVLEPAVRAFLERIDAAPPPRSMERTAYRAQFDELQADESTTAIYERWITIPVEGVGPLRLRIVTPTAAESLLAAVVYLHGGGWVAGNAHTHDRLARELSVRSGVAIVFPEYALSPEARYPTALEQSYAAAQWVADSGADHGLDPARIAIAGDSEGANLAICVVLLALQRDTSQFKQLVAFTPATDATFDTPSHLMFAEGYGLRRDTVRWFWEQYVPDPTRRRQSTASPLRADQRELARFPPTLIITAEADVLRDEGEAFAARLREAGAASAAVRYEGTIHDFVVLDSLKDTSAARAATAQAVSALTAALNHGHET